MVDLTLTALKAKHGDALFLTANGARVLIDGGPSGVYSRTLRDYLLNLDSEGDEPPRIDLLMVSHIDADHIDGILDLTAELLEARDEERDPIVKIDRAWHNSFSDMIAKGPDGMASSSVKASSAEVAEVFDDLSGEMFDPHEAKLVLSSVAQGRQLRLDLKALNIDLNQRFDKKIVLQGSASKPWKCGTLTLTVIGPTQAELDKLRKEWAKQLEKILKKEEEASAAALELDRSVSNLASIVVMAEANGKTALLTGDARGDMIVKWLQDVGKLEPGKSIHFDIVKVPHHGGEKNVSPEFFRAITADHYVISGNGGHGNPEPATLEMLFNARPELDYQIHMTYGPNDLKKNKKFKKVGNVEKLESVLSDPKRCGVLRFPNDEESIIKIVV